MATKKFKDLKPGERFQWQGVTYEKLLLTDYQPPYGFVNCIGPAFYEEDKGYRYIYENQEVLVKEQ